MEKTVSIQKIRKCAEELFQKGGLYCSEAVVYAVRENIAQEMPEQMVAAASGFPGGIGGSGCVCGAVAGGVIALGYFFGRTGPGQAAKSAKTLGLANELEESFRKSRKGVLCCRVLTKGMDKAAGEHKAQCAAFTGEVAAKTAEILAREFGLEVVG